MRRRCSWRRRSLIQSMRPPDSPPSGEASSCQGSARSTASGRAATPAQSGRASRPSRRQSGRAPRPAARLALRFSGEKRGTTLRKSVLSNLRVFINRTGEEALAERAEWHKANPQFFTASVARPSRVHATKASTRSATPPRAARRARGGSTARLPRTNQSISPCPGRISSFTAPATSSMGTSGSTRCW